MTRTRAFLIPTIAVSLTLAALAFSASYAAEPRTTARRFSDPEAVRAYWTPERLAAARPMPIPVADVRLAEAARVEVAASAGSGSSYGSHPRRPRAGVLPDFNNYILDPRLVRRPRAKDLRRRLRASAMAPEAELPLKARGSLDLDFTSSRLTPEDARTAFPYSAAGKLFFRDSGSNFVCSGGVISARVVVTAGHCVFIDGDFVTNLMFVPAYHLGQAPFGEWMPNLVITTPEWMADEDVPNAADIGVMVKNDQQFGGATMKIGDVTGWFGYKLNTLSPNHVHILGFPGDIDNGQRMHQITSGQSEEFPPNTAFYGSDMGGGSSGGPWIQNFGKKGAGGLQGSRNKAANRMVGVTSYAATNREAVSGASAFAGSFRTAFNQACNDAAGNCRQRGKPREI